MIFAFYFQGMIMLILATDMARHGEILEAFKQKLENFDWNNEDHLNSVRTYHTLPLYDINIYITNVQHRLLDDWNNIHTCTFVLHRVT